MSAPDLTAHQHAAVRRIADWYVRGEREYVLGGYAGTGKTTVLGALPALLGLDPADVLYLTPTNQARAVLAGKLAAPSDVSTVFGHLYHGLARHCAACPESPLNGAVADGCHSGLRDGGCCWLDREQRAATVRRELVVVDEASMVPADQAELLRATSGRLLVVGDPAQLPPVDREHPGFSMVSRVDDVLTEVLRTGPGSAVLELATAVRSGLALPAPDPGGAFRVLPAGSAVPWAWQEDGQDVRLDAVLTQTNVHRRALNAARRMASGGLYGDGPGVGEQLLSVRRQLAGQVYNGQRFVVAEAGPGWRTVATAGGVRYRVQRDDWDRCDAEGHPFHYGYAMTAHRAQGSEFDRVLVYPPSRGSAEELRRWLYTAVTRARVMVALAQW